MPGRRIIVRERTRTRRCVVLRDDPLAVLAFWSDTAVLLRLGARVKPVSLLDDLPAIPARGLPGWMSCSM